MLALTKALGYDLRIGHRYLAPGLGFGGGCLPKDLRALTASAADVGAEEAFAFLDHVDRINTRRRQRTVALALEECRGSVLARRVAVLGAAFKPDTDDVRDSPALDVAARLHLQGADVAVYDPRANVTAARVFPALTYVDDVEAAVEERTWCCTSPSGRSSRPWTRTGCTPSWRSPGSWTPATRSMPNAGGGPAGPSAPWAPGTTATASDQTYSRLHPLTPPPGDDEGPRPASALVRALRVCGRCRIRTCVGIHRRITERRCPRADLWGSPLPVPFPHGFPTPRRHPQLHPCQGPCSCRSAIRSQFWWRRAWQMGKVGVMRRDRVYAFPSATSPRRRARLRRRQRWYFALMGTCLALIVLAWNVVRLWSTTAAVAMSVVAAGASAGGRTDRQSARTTNERPTFERRLQGAPFRRCAMSTFRMGVAADSSAVGPPVE